MSEKKISPRWAFEDSKGITCYVYSAEEPKHMLSQSITNLRRAGHYDYVLNVVVSDEPIAFFEGRNAPGA